MNDSYQNLKDQRRIANNMMVNLASMSKCDIIDRETNGIVRKWVSFKAEKQYEELRKLVNQLDKQINEVSN